MADRFYKFAERAIATAGEAGKRKREHAIRLAEMGAKSRMAELERTQTGLTRRQGMVEAGSEARHKREYGAPSIGDPIGDPGGFRYAEVAGKKRGGLLSGKASESTRMKSFDYASKAMSEMYPEGINPVTNKPFSSEAWEKRLVELAESREAYGGVQPAEERPAGLSGRGRVLRESGEMYDIEPGVEGYTKSMATPGMIEAAGFAPRVPANRASQMMAGEKATKKPSKALLRLREKYKDIYPAAIKGFRGFTGGW